MYAARKAAEARERGKEARELGDEVQGRRWETQAEYFERIASKVDQAPPLTAAQRDRLAVLLRPTVSASGAFDDRPRSVAA